MTNIDRHHESSPTNGDDLHGREYCTDDERSLRDREAHQAALDKEEKIVTLTAVGLVGAIFGAAALKHHRKNNK